MPVHGIDVSHHQGRINWNAVAGDGLQFAIAKATEGSTFTDSRFTRNYRDAAAEGLIRGAYHFLHPGHAQRQAQHYLNVVERAGGPDGALLAVDVETTGTGTHPGKNDLAAFLTELRRHVGADRPVAVYTGHWYWNGILGDPPLTDLGPVWLWHSRYLAVPGTWQQLVPRIPQSWFHQRVGGLTPTVLQYSSSGAMRGIAGRVDLNLYPDNLASLQALAGKDTTLTPAQEAKLDELLRRTPVVLANKNAWTSDRQRIAEGVLMALREGRTRGEISALIRAQLAPLIAELGGFRGAITALIERGGIDAAEIQAAAEAGALAALTILGDTLTTDLDNDEPDETEQAE